MKKNSGANDLVQPGNAESVLFSVSPDGECHQDASVSSKLKENRSRVQKIFAKDATLVCRDFSSANAGGPVCCAFYFDGLADSKTVYDSIVRPVIETPLTDLDAETLSEQVLFNAETKRSEHLKECCEAMMDGDTVVFCDGSASALIVNSKGFPVRSVTEPEGEKVLLGPREGFTESVLQNTAMLHRRLKTFDFRAESMTFGKRTRAKAFLCYLGSLAKPEILREIRRRLEKIDIDGVLDVNYLSEQIADNRRSLFKTVGATERPDSAAAQLLEGRVVLLLDGTPVALVVPYLFVENFQSSEDYYVHFYLSCVGRILRIFCFFMTILIPGVFVALASFHQEMLPTELALSLMQSREGVPFPIAVECLLMIVIFEILREASQRLPDSIAQALSIVGAIVLGDAAVSAHFIGATTLIIIAFSGIAGLMSPKLKDAVIFIRIYILIFSSLLGLYGVLIGFLTVILHLMSLKSFGVPYLTGWFAPHFQSQKDMAIRAPWWTMRNRPEVLSTDEVRQHE